MENTANVVADDLDDRPRRIVRARALGRGAAGELDAPLGSGPRLVVRQFFYDWANEEPANLAIECIGTPPAPDRPARPRAPVGCGGGVPAPRARRVPRGQHRLLARRRGGRARPGDRTVFREPAALTQMGAAAENVSVWGSWQLGGRRGPSDRGHPATGALLERVARATSGGRPSTTPIVSRASTATRPWSTTTVCSERWSRTAIRGSPTGSTPPATAKDPLIFRWLRAEDAPVPGPPCCRSTSSARHCPPATVTGRRPRRPPTGAERRASLWPSTRRFRPLTGGAGMDLGLADATAVVTGGTKGMGRAIAECLAGRAPGWRCWPGDEPRSTRRWTAIRAAGSPRCRRARRRRRRRGADRRGVRRGRGAGAPSTCS